MSIIEYRPIFDFSSLSMMLVMLLQLYPIRWRKTSVQGLLFMCFILMFIVLAINTVMFDIAPQYTMYGSQHYVTNVRAHCLRSTLVLSIVRAVKYQI